MSKVKYRNYSAHYYASMLGSELNAIGRPDSSVVVVSMYIYSIRKRCKMEMEMMESGERAKLESGEALRV